MTLLPRLFDHLLWADERARDAIGTLDGAAAERSDATRLYAHVAAAEHVWLARLRGIEPRHAVWGDLTLDAAAELARTTVGALREFAAGDATALAREVDYRTTRGQPCRESVADILLHVALHGSHHRGQIALVVRRGGGDPAATDYIAFVRDRAAADANPAGRPGS